MVKTGEVKPLRRLQIFYQQQNGSSTFSAHSKSSLFSWPELIEHGGAKF